MKGEKIEMKKTFCYESNCLRYRNCFFDMGEYEDGKMSLDIYGYVEKDKDISFISNMTVDVDEQLPRNQVVVDSYANTNLISFLLELGVIKRVVRRVIANAMRLPVVEVDLEKLKEYCYEEENLKYAS